MSHIVWAEAMKPSDGPPVLNATEQEAMDAVVKALHLICDWGLVANQAELTAGVHVIQSFITQHMLQRLAPEEWGAWYTAERSAERRA